MPTISDQELDNLLVLLGDVDIGNIRKEYSNFYQISYLRFLVYFSDRDWDNVYVYPELLSISDRCVSKQATFQLSKNQKIKIKRFYNKVKNNLKTNEEKQERSLLIDLLKKHNICPS